MRKVLCIVLISVLSACANDSVPEGILEPNKMQMLVYDLLKVDEYINNYVVKDTSVDKKMKRSILYEQVFKLHNTNRKEFYTSYRYYQQNPNIQKTLFDSLLAKSGRVKAEIPRIVPMKSLKVK